MIIKQISDSDCLTSFGALDYVCSESVKHESSVCGEVYFLVNKHLTCLNKIPPEVLDKVYYIDDTLSTTAEKIQAKFKELTANESDYVNFLDEILTRVVNTYLDIYLELNCNVDSALLDYDELISYLESTNTGYKGLYKLQEILLDFFYSNYKHLDVLKHALEKLQIKKDDDSYSIQVPFVFKTPIAFLRLSTDSSVREYFKLRNAIVTTKLREQEISESSLLYEFVTKLEEVSDGFKKFGYIDLYYHSDKQFYGYEKVSIFKTLSGKFFLRF